MDISGIIERLGGSVALSGALGFPGGDVGAKRIRAWAARASIPTEYWLAITNHSKSLGLDITLEVLAVAHAREAQPA